MTLLEPLRTLSGGGSMELSGQQKNQRRNGIYVSLNSCVYQLRSELDGDPIVAFFHTCPGLLFGPSPSQRSPKLDRKVSPSGLP